MKKPGLTGLFHGHCHLPWWQARPANQLIGSTRTKTRASHQQATACLASVSKKARFARIAWDALPSSWKVLDVALRRKDLCGHVPLTGHMLGMSAHTIPQQTIGQFSHKGAPSGLPPHSIEFRQRHAIGTGRREPQSRRAAFFHACWAAVSSPRSSANAARDRQVRRSKPASLRPWLA